jgi:hypothetical protein
MRKALPILLVAGLISVLLEAVTGPVPTDARITPKLVTNGVSINGLHVALPAHMKSFPAGAVAVMARTR